MEEKRKGFRFPNEIRNIALFITVLLIFDAVIIQVWSPYLQKNFAIFSGKSEATMLSDLLFGEGAIILGIGVFATIGGSKMSMSRQYPGQYYKEGEMMTDHIKSRPREIRIGILVLIVGAVLLGLSILVGVLFGAV
jgi:hypothetical protein